MTNIIIGKVINVINEYRIVINKGKVDGVKMSNRFLVYKLGNEMFDPDTNESLGTLELVCGEGKPEHIQEHMTTLHTSKIQIKEATKTIKRRGYGLIGTEIEEINEPEENEVPFESVDTDCIVRQIK